MPPFELNVPVVDECGTLLFVLDALWRELRAGLEIDSREYHFSEEDWDATMARHNILARCGLELTHYSPRRARGAQFPLEVGQWLKSRSTAINVPIPPGHCIRRPPLGRDPEPYVVRLRA